MKPSYSLEILRLVIEMCNLEEIDKLIAFLQTEKTRYKLYERRWIKTLISLQIRKEKHKAGQPQEEYALQACL